MIIIIRIVQEIKCSPKCLNQTPITVVPLYLAGSKTERAIVPPPTHISTAASSMTKTIYRRSNACSDCRGNWKVIQGH